MIVERMVIGMRIVLMVLGLLVCLPFIAFATEGTATLYTPYQPSSCYGLENRGVMIAAASDAIWNNRAACGTKYRVRCIGATNQDVPQPCKGRSVEVQIVDYCPAGCQGTIDLSIEAFTQIADPSAGRIRIEYSQEVDKSTYNACAKSLETPKFSCEKNFDHQTRSAIATYTILDTISPKQSLSDDETLVSANEIFELGFFSPSNSKNRYLGIWYKQAPHKVVWVANRDNPITDSYGVLTISNIGKLVILNQTGSTIWSSNISSKPKNPFLQLLNSGNLVLRENGSTSYLWQSFDYPSDTLLQGMKLRWNIESGQERYLTSWKASDDPSTANSSLKIDKKALPQLVLLMGMAKKFRTGVWDGVQFSGSPPYEVHQPFMEFDGHEWSYRFEKKSNEFLAIVTTVSEYMSVQLLILSHGSSEWSLLYSVPFGPCSNYGYCGANGICRISKNPVCECLEGFTPKSSEEWRALNWTSGCIRRIPLECHPRDQFMQLTAIKVPDLLEIRLNRSLTLEECKVECSRTCSCTAYANFDVRKGGSGCVMWFGDLVDMRDFVEGKSEQEIYIRLAAAELGQNESMNKSKRKNRKKRKMTIMVIAIISGMSVLLLTSWCIIRNRETETKRRVGIERKEDLALPTLDIATIAAATNNFSDSSMLGEGGFGPVYKGSLSTGEEIAVKRLSKNSRQGVQEFKNEVLLIAKLQHRNLVGLLGCCIEGEERMLIYEYMSNKSLDHFIFGRSKSLLLDWEKRFNIIVGIARGLLYLHQDSKLQIIHRDLKGSNILLDSNMNPKISDFGLARIVGGDEIETKTKKVVGTYGYMSPEYALDGKFSMKSDVFSYGVVLLEIVSGRRNRGFSHPDHHHNLLGHTWLLWNDDNALDLLDPSLEDSYIEYQVLRCIQVGLLCVQKFPADRPTMASVVFMLANDGVKLPWPKQPAFFIERTSNDVNSMPTMEEQFTKNDISITSFEGR